MHIHQHFKEDLFSNFDYCRIIYRLTDPETPVFEYTLLGFIIITKLLFYVLLTVVALFSIYYTFHFACLIDDACFALNYGVKL